MKNTRSVLTALAGIALVVNCELAVAQTSVEPLRIEIREGVIRPVPLAIPAFVAESQGADSYAVNIKNVVVADLTGTGLFREIPRKRTFRV